MSNCLFVFVLKTSTVFAPGFKNNNVFVGLFLCFIFKPAPSALDFTSILISLSFGVKIKKE